MKEKLTSQEIGEETFSGKVEEWVEAVHGVSKIDKKKAVEKMLAELKKRDREKEGGSCVVDSRRIGGCGNTCVLYLDTVVTMGKRDIGRGEDYDCRFDRDKGTDFDHDGERTCVLSQEILDLKKAKRDTV